MFFCYIVFSELLISYLFLNILLDVVQRRITKSSDISFVQFKLSYVYAYMYACIIDRQTYRCKYVCMRTLAHVHVHVYIHVIINIYIYRFFDQTVAYVHIVSLVLSGLFWGVHFY